MNPFSAEELHKMMIISKPQSNEAGLRHRPLVSVILPVHNEERHIEDVLQSRLLQETVSLDLEIIILDGESSVTGGVGRIRSHETTGAISSGAPLRAAAGTPAFRATPQTLSPP